MKKIDEIRKYIKHILKDPVNNIAEADARAREIVPITRISLAVLGLGLFLQVVFELDFCSFLSGIGLLGAALSGFLLEVINRAKERFEAVTCNKCNTMAEFKTQEDFYRYIRYRIVRDGAVYERKKEKISPSNGVYSLVKVEATSEAVAEVIFICPHCGEEKKLKYSAHPFKCHTEKKNVKVQNYQTEFLQMETAVKNVVAEYNNPEMRNRIPYTIHSSKNPNFENRFTFKGTNASDARPEYMGVRIDYRKDVEEMLEHYLVINEQNGILRDESLTKFQRRIKCIKGIFALLLGNQQNPDAPGLDLSSAEGWKKAASRILRFVKEKLGKINVGGLKSKAADKMDGIKNGRKKEGKTAPTPAQPEKQPEAAAPAPTPVPVEPEIRNQVPDMPAKPRIVQPLKDRETSGHPVPAPVQPESSRKRLLRHPHPGDVRKRWPIPSRARVEIFCSLRWQPWQC